VTSRYVELPLQIEDPVERLLAVQRNATAIKEHIRLSAGANREEWTEHLPPLFVKLQSRLLNLAVRVAKPAGMFSISAVPGPREPLWAGLAPVENFVSVGHMKHCASINCTAWSYTDKLNVAFYTCAEAVPDLWRLCDHVETSFAELVREVAARAPRAA
jgi:hypothetical protein